jgi:Domain of unknown function (DUF4129)
VGAPIPTGSTPHRTGARARGTDDVVMTWGIVAITFCLCCGLLVGALALPLYWLPGQLAMLVVFLWATPAAVVRIRRGAVGLFGHAAASYARRTRLAVLAALALFLVALPAYEWRLLGHGGLTAAFAVPVVVAVVLGMVALSVAGDLAGAWLLLQRQEWEDAKYVGWGIVGMESERVTRLNRTEVMRRLWRRWGAGAVLLGLALLASGHRLAGGQSLAVPWGVLALVVYLALGLILMGRAAQLRWSTEWELEQVPAAPQVAAGWRPMAVATGVAVLLLAGLLALSPLLALAHSVLGWLWVAVLLPVMRWLLPWLARFLQSGGISSGLNGVNRGLTPPRIHSGPMHPAPQHATSAFWLWLAELWTWLTHSWLYLLGLVAVVTLAWAYRQARRAQGGTGGPWSILIALLKELHVLLLALWRPATQLTAQAVRDVQRRATRAVARGGAWRHRRLREMGPRQAIIALYVAALRLAARRGYPRRPSQTPHEYAAEVSERLPQARDALGSLTETFVAVRYGGHAADDSLVARMQALAGALRKALRRAPRSHASS